MHASNWPRLFVLLQRDIRNGGKADQVDNAAVFFRSEDKKR